MRVPENYLEQLRAAGLIIQGPFPAGHRAFPDGVMMSREQETVHGNLAGLKSPVVWLHTKDERWYVNSLEYVPGPGPGDFGHEFATAEEAVADILDFFFGNPARIAAKGCLRQRGV
jgi:hypothetical protein